MTICLGCGCPDREHDARELCGRCGSTCAPPDEDFLADYARERQTAAANHETRGGDRCARCRCRWHAMRCTCGCVTSWEVAS